MFIDLLARLGLSFGLALGDLGLAKLKPERWLWVALAQAMAYYQEKVGKSRFCRAKYICIVNIYDDLYTLAFIASQRIIIDQLIP